MAPAKEKKTLQELLEDALIPEEDQPYPIPKNWVWVFIGKISKVIGGGTPRTNMIEYYENGDIPWITPADLSNHKDIYISEGRRNITKLGLKNSSARLLKKGILLLSSRAPVGYVAVAKNELCTNQGFKSFESYGGFLPIYGYWYLKFSKPIIEAMSSGTTFKEISGSKSAMIPIPIPPMDEQLRIVSKLDSMLGKIAEAKDLIQEARESFAKRRSTILHKAFTGELTKKWREENPENTDKNNEVEEILEKNQPYKIPKTWKWVKLVLISELITKGSSPKWQGFDYISDKNQLLFITSENVDKGFLNLKKEKYLDMGFNKIQKRSILKKGDVLLNIVGASIGRAAIFNLNKSANINQAVAIIRLKNIKINMYLNFYLNSKHAERYYYEKKVDVARANLSLKDVSNIPIPLPSLDEQKEIVRILDKIFSYEDEAKVLSELEEEISLLEKSILSKAFRGELGTHNPDDEPALELLKKALKERSKQI